MSTIIAPAGLVNLLAPVPTPPQYDLLAAATIVDQPNERWLGGGWTGGDPPGPAFTHDPCSTGTNRVKESPGVIATQMEGRFTVYLPGFCTAQSVGPDPTFFTDRLKLSFQAYEGAAVERTLATGDGHTTLGPYLGDPNMEILGGGAVSPVEGLALLERAVARHASGMIHVAPATATYWESLNLLVSTAGVKRTKAKGTPVAVGAGYTGVHPDGESSPATDQEWAFASGPIEVIRGDVVEVMPTNYSEAIDRSVNDVQFLAERPYLFNWIARQSSDDDDHTQAGVLIDRIP